MGQMQRTKLASFGMGQSQGLKHLTWQNPAPVARNFALVSTCYKGAANMLLLFVWGSNMGYRVPTKPWNLSFVHPDGSWLLFLFSVCSLGIALFPMAYECRCYQWPLAAGSSCYLLKQLDVVLQLSTAEKSKKEKFVVVAGGATDLIAFSFPFPVHCWKSYPSIIAFQLLFLRIEHN